MVGRAMAKRFALLEQRAFGVTHTLRAEARPTDWPSLYANQHAAVKRLLDMLTESAESLPEIQANVPVRANWVNEDRKSRIAFLFGSRGSGKTTVFLSLEEACNGLRWDKSLRTYPPELQPKAEALRRRLVWLRPLDMELVGANPNLLASIVTRLEDACQPAMGSGTTGGRDTGRERGGLLATEHIDPLMELQRLRANITIAWDSNLAERRGHLDPLNYAAEAMRFEQARMTLVDNLDFVLYHLAAMLHRSRHRDNPLFVLPVDDFDLNPSACLELLQVIRMVSLPRLFFLVLGDLDVAEVLLNLKLSNDMASVGYQAARAELLPLPRGDVASIAAEIGANAIRKLVPPGQRVPLENLSLVEALNLRPISHQAATLPRLHELLTRCWIRRVISDSVRAEGGEESWHSLLEFLTSPGQSWTPTEGVKTAVDPDGLFRCDAVDRTFYSGLSALRGSMRQLVDLWYGLQSVAQTTTGKPSVDDMQERERQQMKFLARQCMDAAQAEPGLPPEVRRALAEAFQPSLGERWNLSQLPVAFEDESSLACQFAGETIRVRENLTKNSPLQIETSCSSEFSFSQSLARRMSVKWQVPDRSSRLSLLGVLSSSRDVAKQLSHAITGLITVFHDTVVFGPWTPSRGSLILNNDVLTKNWAFTQWRSGDKNVSLSWPRPNCAAIHTLDYFRFTWNDFLAEAMSSREDPQAALLAAFAWMGIGTDALTRGGFQRPSLSRTKLQPDVLDWYGLAEELSELIPNPGDRSHNALMNREWLVRLALFFTPEMGLPWPKLNWRRPGLKELLEFWTRREWRAVVQRRAAWSKELRSSMPELIATLEQRTVAGLQGSLFSDRAGLTGENEETSDEGDEANPGEKAGNAE